MPKTKRKHKRFAVQCTARGCHFVAMLCVDTRKYLCPKHRCRRQRLGSVDAELIYPRWTRRELECVLAIIPDDGGRVAFGDTAEVAEHIGRSHTAVGAMISKLRCEGLKTRLEPGDRPWADSLAFKLTGNGRNGNG